MVTEFSGQLMGFNRGIVTVKRDDGAEVMVQIPDNLASFQFVATAKPAFLKRGAMVRFSGTFNQAGVSMSPVTKVELFQPTSGKLIGRQREQFVPGVYPQGELGKQQPPPVVANCAIVGGLMGIDGNGVMLVNAGKRPIRVQLTEDVKFEIRFNNLSLAEEGDPVRVAGFYQPPDDTKIKAESITVTTDRIFGEQEPETPRRVSRRRTKRTKTEVDPEEAKEGDVKKASNEPDEPNVSLSVESS